MGAMIHPGQEAYQSMWFVNFCARIPQVLRPEIPGIHGSSGLYSVSRPDKRTALVAEPFRQKDVAGLRVVLITARYGCAGKTYCPVKPNLADLPILVILLTQVFNNFGPLTYILPTFLAKKKVSRRATRSVDSPGSLVQFADLA